MKKLLNIIGIGLLFIVLLPVIIILIPISLILGLIDVPLKKRRIAKLRQSVKDKWLTHRKYIYISISDEINPELADLIRHEIMPKYGKHLIVDSWADSTNTWTHGWGKLAEKVDKVVAADIIEDCDGCIDICVTSILPTTEFFEDPDTMLLLCDDDDGIREYGKLSEPEAITLEEARKMILDKVHSSLKAWDIPITKS